ncbi:hypothetical protein JTB14_011232 [Gonioctena quinquepunctata]|nr:hypothetical protein JTB14_011232 [Gonioctena quinquepunctata]
MAYSKISNNSSHNSQVSLERQRIAIEMEKKKQTLEKQKLEIDNNMRLLQMEHDLENARLDAIEEVRSHRSQSNGTNERTTISTQQRNKVPHCLYPEVMVVNDKFSSSDHEQFDLEVASKYKFTLQCRIVSMKTAFNWIHVLPQFLYYPRDVAEANNGRPSRVLFRLFEFEKTRGSRSVFVDSLSVFLVRSAAAVGCWEIMED